MQLKLFHKLFLVLVGTSLCSVLLFAGFAHWYSSCRFLLGGGAFALVLSLLAAAWVARRLSRPITQIGAGARALAKGQFATRLPPLGRDEIGELAGDFSLLARTLEDNESVRRRWFADVSHELGTPLAIMRGELEAASDGIRRISARQACRSAWWPMVMRCCRR